MESQKGAFKEAKFKNRLDAQLTILTGLDHFPAKFNKHFGKF